MGINCLAGKEFEKGDEDIGDITVYSYGYMEDVVWEASGFTGKIKRT